MANFCTNCGTKIRNEDNFCTNCGTKIKEDGNFCIECGTKLEKEDNFCTNCGAKIDKSDMKQSKHLLKSVYDSIEQDRARRAKEKEEKKKKLKTIDEIFESEEIKSEIIKNNISQKYVFSIKYNLNNKLINKKEEMNEEEIKYFIKIELEKANKEQKKAKIKKEKEIHSKYEEFMDSGGGIVGDFDSEGYVEYYCRLGHSLSFGRFCEDYEWMIPIRKLKIPFKNKAKT